MVPTQDFTYLRILRFLDSLSEHCGYSSRKMEGGAMPSALESLTMEWKEGLKYPVIHDSAMTQRRELRVLRRNGMDLFR